MKISQIDIRGFLALDHVTIPLRAPINIFAGSNEAGKSSIRDALQWGLTGRARGFTTHEQQAALIRDGAKAAEVSIVTPGGTIHRKKTPKSPASVSGPVPDDQVMAAILCDPLTFLSMPDDKRREVLFRLIPGLNPNDAEIAGILAEKSGKVPPDLDKAKIINSLASMAASKGFPAAATEAITRRRMAKRVRDEAQVQEPETQATIGGVLRILPDIQKSDVQAGIDSLQKDRDALLQKRGKTEGDLDKLPDLENGLAELLANPVEAPDPGEADKIRGFLDINRPILDRLKEKIAAIHHGTPAQKFPADCPACPVLCPSAGKEAVPAIEPSDPDQAAKLQADLQEQEEEVRRLEGELKAAEGAQAASTAYTERCQALTGQIAALKDRKAQSAATAKIDQEIAALYARLTTGRELLAAVQEFWRQKDEADAAQEKIAAAEKEIDLYDVLAKALAPDGIPSQLIAEALGPVNGKLAIASGYLFPDCDEHEPVHLTSDLEVYRGAAPYAILSKSARYRVGIAFQYVLAQLAGARLLMIDEADILDPQNRANLVDFLLAVKDDFDTVLVFATSDHADPSPIPEMQVWWVEGGQVRPVRAREAA